jgi:hypothetical protein
MKFKVDAHGRVLRSIFRVHGNRVFEVTRDCDLYNLVSFSTMKECVLPFRGLDMTGDDTRQPPRAHYTVGSDRHKVGRLSRNGVRT